jgi:hypothetical protein
VSGDGLVAAPLDGQFEFRRPLTHRFRRNIYEPEVITFDELLARAEWHVAEACDDP